MISSDDSNAVRVIDAFVDALDLAELGFDSVELGGARTARWRSVF